MTETAADPASSPTLIDLEFDTTANHGAPLGDIASSLVSIHDLLRDLAALAASPSGPEYRDIRVVAIEMRSPLTITLALRAIPDEAVKAFQELGRAVIRFRERQSPRAAMDAAESEDVTRNRHAAVSTALKLVTHAEADPFAISASETQRLYDHVLTLQRAEVPLKRVMVKA
jgi:hypothetical protein